MEAKNNKENGINVIENVENEVQVTEESRKAYGRPSINEEKGWKLDHVIPFDFYHDAYIKSRASIDELVNMVLQECNIKPDDTCSWAKDIRTIIKHEIMKYDEQLDASGETPDEWNQTVSGTEIGDAIEIRSEAYYSAENFVPHTFEEVKEEYIREGSWETFLAISGMTEAECKKNRDSRYAHLYEA